MIGSLQSATVQRINEITNPFAITIQFIIKTKADGINSQADLTVNTLHLMAQIELATLGYHRAGKFKDSTICKISTKVFKN